MGYNYEQFKYASDLKNFLNEKKIKRENIVSIYSNGYMHYLIYIAE